jgi:hypothetical protein
MTTLQNPVVQLLNENPTKMWSMRTIQSKLEIPRKKDATCMIQQAIKLTQEQEIQVRQVNPLEVGSGKTAVDVFTVKKK